MGGSIKPPIDLFAFIVASLWSLDTGLWTLYNQRHE